MIENFSKKIIVCLWAPTNITTVQCNPCVLCVSFCHRKQIKLLRLNSLCGVTVIRVNIQCSCVDYSYFVHADVPGLI